MTKIRLSFLASLLCVSCTVCANPFFKQQQSEASRADIPVKENVPAEKELPPAVVEVKDAQPETQEKKPHQKRQSKITSKKTFYDRREGVAYFEGDVFVDDAEYQLHAQKVYVFLDGTNDLRRIVAVGNVAMTNGLKRAYAEKASYYKRNGMVVLTAGENTLAEVYDDSKGDSQSVKGSKIRFWTSADQVEVVDANISAPTKGGIKGGFGNLKDALGK
jgi:lipopolysaccharide transport protein LptA